MSSDVSFGSQQRGERPTPPRVPPSTTSDPTARGVGNERVSGDSQQSMPTNFEDVPPPPPPHLLLPVTSHRDPTARGDITSPPLLPQVLLQLKMENPAVHAYIAGLERECILLRARNRDLCSSKDVLKGQIDSLIATLDTKSAENDDLYASSCRERRSFRLASQEVELLKSEILNLKDRYDEVTGDRDTLNGAVAAMSKKNDDLEAENWKLRTDNIDLRASADALASELSNQTEIKEECYTHIGTLTQKCRSLESKVDILKSTVDFSNTLELNTIVTLRRELREKEEELRCMRTRFTKVTEELSIANNIKIVTLRRLLLTSEEELTRRSHNRPPHLDVDF